MIITLNDISRRFNFDWIFRNIQYTFSAGNAYAIIGPNGSGKSTLLRVIAGQLTPSGGELHYQLHQNVIPVDQIYRHVTYAAPYLDIMDDFTLEESLHFHAGFKPWLKGLSHAEVLAITQLQAHKNKQIRHFSSGMKQRVKLVMAVCAQSDILILDEPTTNLDEAGAQWYTELISAYCQDRIILVGSNQQREYTFCNAALNIADYKVKQTVG